MISVNSRDDYRRHLEHRLDMLKAQQRARPDDRIAGWILGIEESLGILAVWQQPEAANEAGATKDAIAEVEDIVRWANEQFGHNYGYWAHMKSREYPVKWIRVALERYILNHAAGPLMHPLPYLNTVLINWRQNGACPFLT